MPKVNMYNLYDNGELVLENVTGREIKQYLENDTLRVSQYAAEERLYKDRYTFERCDAQEKEDTLEEVIFKVRWEEVVGLFKNVTWVKRGGKQLRVGGIRG